MNKIDKILYDKKGILIQRVEGIALLFIDGGLVKTHLTEQDIRNFTKTRDINL